MWHRLPSFSAEARPSRSHPSCWQMIAGDALWPSRQRLLKQIWAQAHKDCCRSFPAHHQLEHDTHKVPTWKHLQRSRLCLHLIAIAVQISHLRKISKIRLTLLWPQEGQADLPETWHMVLSCLDVVPHIFERAAKSSGSQGASCSCGA